MMPPPGWSRKVAMAARQSVAGRDETDRERALPRCPPGGEVGVGVGRLVDAGVVHQNVDVAAPGERLVPERVGRGGIAQVGCERMGCVAQLGGELGQPALAADVVHDHPGALGGEGAGGRGADAAGRACDEDDALTVRAHELSE